MELTIFAPSIPLEGHEIMSLVQARQDELDENSSPVHFAAVILLCPKIKENVTVL